MQNLEDVLEDQNELVLIFDDFMKISPFDISRCFINAFANECMVTLLEALSSSKKTTLSLKVVLLIASILLSNIRNPLFSDFLIFCFFGKYYTPALRAKLMNAVAKPMSYSKKWKFKGFWDTYQTHINDYCSQVYFPNLQDTNCEPFQITKEEKTQQKPKEKRSIFGMGPNFYDQEVEKI
jgi:hypothetical protein